MSRDETVQWFHGKLSREAAEQLLRENLHEDEEGLFLVRECSTAVGDYVLSVLHKGDVVHYQIRKHGEDAFFSIDEETIIHGLDTLIEHYQESSHGLITKLGRSVKKNPPPPDSRRHGRTNLLHRATKEGNYMVVSELLKCGYRSIDAKNQEGKTAVHLASELGMDDILKKLIEAAASVNARDTAGYTPLHYAAQMNKPTTVTILIDLGGANPQARNPETGWVPLHEAASRGHSECIEKLLSRNAPVRPRTTNNETPSELALKGGHTECYRLLEDYCTPSARVSQEDWYHGLIDRQEAQVRLHGTGSNSGAFLVRQTPRKPGIYVLTMLHGGHLFNFEIQKKDQHYYIDDGPYLESLEHVIHHYSSLSDGLPTTLHHPVKPQAPARNLEVNGVASTTLESQKSLRRPSPNEKRLPLPPVPLPRKVAKSHAATTPPAIVAATSPVSNNSQQSIPKEALVLGSVLGEGEFGAVFKATYTSPDGTQREVAVKTLQTEQLQGSREEFLQEAQVMMRLHHHCIVSLVGICQGPPLLMVQELVPMGSLLDYLVTHQDKVNPIHDLRLWAAQIACGMLYLEKERFVHRDLAARNILLASRNQAKISDFGLSRALGAGREYYRASQGGRWPLKWYAPESVNFGTFSHASDVWSYGVTLWEMFSLGEQPYGDMKGVEVMDLIERGERLACPSLCPAATYQVLERCWAHRPQDRPSFQELLRVFTSDPDYANLSELVVEREIT